jgi:hypothetical protein
MHKQKLAMMLIILVGGTAVLVSYVHAFLTNPAATEAAWGGVTPDVRPIYGVFMLMAMLGYFAYTYFIFFRLDPEEARIANRFGFTVFNVIYVAILIPSALYMPLTFKMLEQPSAGLWWTVRLDLAVVGVASLGLIGALLTLRPRRPAWAYWLALAGSVAFSIQTALLDALIWPALFPL